jgi:hypothetical protein
MFGAGKVMPTSFPFLFLTPLSPLQPLSRTLMLMGAFPRSIPLPKPPSRALIAWPLPLTNIARCQGRTNLVFFPWWWKWQCRFYHCSHTKQRKEPRPSSPRPTPCAIPGRCP